MQKARKENKAMRVFLLPIFVCSLIFIVTDVLLINVLKSC